MGFLNTPGSDPVPAGDSHPLLGQVLRRERDSRLVRLHRSHSCTDRVHRLCRALLSITDVAQVRGDSVRNPGTRDPQGADGERPHGAPAQEC